MQMLETLNGCKQQIFYLFVIKPNGIFFPQ